MRATYFDFNKNKRQNKTKHYEFFKPTYFVPVGTGINLPVGAW